MSAARVRTLPVTVGPLVQRVGVASVSVGVDAAEVLAADPGGARYWVAAHAQEFSYGRLVI